MIESFLTFDSMDRTLKCDHSLKRYCAVLNCGAVLLLDVVLSGVTGVFGRQ